MAVLTQDDLLEAIDKMTVLELSEFIKRFEDRYGVTAAAPVAAAAAPAAGGGADRGRRRSRGADRVHGDARRDRPEQDPGHQGRPRAHRPRPQGGQGPRRRDPEGRQGRRHQRRGRQDQGRHRRGRRQGRDQVGRRWRLGALRALSGRSSSLGARERPLHSEVLRASAVRLTSSACGTAQRADTVDLGRWLWPAPV